LHEVEPCRGASLTQRACDIVKIIEDWEAPTKNSNVSDAAKYHKLAEECRFLSALCSKQEHKAFWLRLERIGTLIVLSIVGRKLRAACGPWDAVVVGPGQILVPRERPGRCMTTGNPRVLSTTNFVWLLVLVGRRALKIGDDSGARRTVAMQERRAIHGRSREVVGDPAGTGTR
jgi:hypothetical protein